MTEIGHQLSAIWQATQGSASDASAQGHLSDISTGWEAVLASPINGVGPTGHLAGLVVENGGSCTSTTRSSNRGCASASSACCW